MVFQIYTLAWQNYKFDPEKPHFPASIFGRFRQRAMNSGELSLSLHREYRRKQNEDMKQDNGAALVERFEEQVGEDLMGFLRKKGAVDEVTPQCPDVEERGGMIARAYLPDGAREFQNYPTASLGWMMFIGMAMAFYWDQDWENHADRQAIYESLRDLRGFDNLDEAITESVLGYEGEAAAAVIDLVADCAARAYSLLRHQQVEPGTQEAFGCYIAALHQLYLAGMAMQLNALGYHMTPLNLN